MLQQDEPDDYVIATGETHSVRELVDVAFEHVGLDPDDHVEIDPRFLRPAEVEHLIGDASKAREKLGWEPAHELRRAGRADGRLRPRAAGQRRAAEAGRLSESVRDPAGECDLAVVGGGIIGLAVARELLTRQPRLSVTVLEREPEVGFHQTGHNSGVIHAGIYYSPGSLKAKLCVEGAAEMYEFCERARRRPRALRQGDRGARRVRAAGAGRARAPRARERRARPAAAERGRAARGRAALPPAWPRCIRPTPASPTSPAWRGRWRPARGARRDRVPPERAWRACRRTAAGCGCATRAARRGRGSPCSAPEAGRTGWR